VVASTVSSGRLAKTKLGRRLRWGRGLVLTVEVWGRSMRVRRRRCRRRTKLPRFSTPLSLSVPLTFPFILQISTHKCTRTTHNTAKLLSPYISLSFSLSISISLCLSFFLSLFL